MSKSVLQDIETACDVLETYKKVILERDLKRKKDIWSLLAISQKKIGIDELEDYLTEHAFEAPVIILIEDFVYKMNVRMAETEMGTTSYQLYKNMRDVADDVSEFFL